MEKTLQNNEAIFIKHHGSRSSIDWVRVKILFDVCTRVEGLDAAEPVWVDPELGQIAYKRIVGLRPLLRPGGALENRMSRIGSLLAKFHQVSIRHLHPSMAASNSYPLGAFALPEGDTSVLNDTLPIGMFHGDCWHGNIWETSDNTFVILDPLPNAWMFEYRHDVGCGGIDLAMLHMSLFMCHPLVRHVATNILEMEAASDALIEGYLESVNAPVGRVRPAILRLSRELASRYVKGYAQRLVWPLAVLKSVIGRKIIGKLDHKLHWEAK